MEEYEVEPIDFVVGEIWNEASEETRKIWWDCIRRENHDFENSHASQIESLARKKFRHISSQGDGAFEIKVRAMGALARIKTILIERNKPGD